MISLLDRITHRERTVTAQPVAANAESRRGQRWLTGAAPAWLRVAVVLATGLLVILTELFLPATLQTYHPGPILLAAVVLATVIGGLWPGFASMIITLLYEIYFYTVHGEVFGYALASMIALVIALPVTVLTIGLLRRHVERMTVERTMLLEQQTELRANELALRKANQRMDEFLGMASHEIKTPLTSIKAGVQLANRQLVRSRQAMAGDSETRIRALDDVQELLARTDRQVSRLNRLVDDLLDVSRIQANKLVIRPARHDLAAIVHEAVEEQREAWPTRTISLDLADDVPVPVMADADRIGQVVTNYLTNALKYSKEDRPVAVSLDTEATLARVAVRDQGPGLSPPGAGTRLGAFPSGQRY